ncbi:MAG: DUF1722 domain-containing protein [Desulfobulbaceae bacterium]|nr:DUF1722 domain-containing protein [Desulfobulbaceae bacterium]
MRIWDISPGYLNRQSLLGEHRELHGIVSIIVNGKNGYSKHPETIRWVGYGWALKQRHRQLTAEMSLRGFTEKSPLNDMRSKEGIWPNTYIDEPFKQFQLLSIKYQNKEPGRIPLPKNTQQLWSHHKYSVLARDVKLYKEIGQDVARTKNTNPSELTMVLTEMLRKPPSIGGVRNTLQHMWGYVSEYNTESKSKIDSWSLSQLLKEIQLRAIASKNIYLTSSTALSELMTWIPEA